MASTYTPLGVELMATGENAGTWGTKTNTNLQIVEQLAGGFTQQAVSDSGDTTLSVSDGSTGATLSHRMIEFTGTISAGRNVTIPIDVQTFYYLKNSTSGSQTVTFKYVTGSGNSVAVGSGETKVVFATANDGTNPDILELPAGDVTLTGTQTLTNKTLTSPKIGTSILDTNGNELALLTATGSAVNEFTIANAATGNPPTLSATGETNVGIAIKPKGSGETIVGSGAANATITSSGAYDLILDTNSGTNSGTITITDAANGDITIAPNGTGVAKAVDGADATGAIKIAGKETIWIPAAAMYAPTTNPADSALVETTATRPDLNVWDFDASTKQYTQFTIAMPKSWNLGTVTYQIFWSPSTTNTGDCIFGLQGVAFGDSDSIDTVYGTAIEVTDAGIGTVEDQQVSSESSAMTIAGSPADDQQSYFQLYRDAADGSDTFTGEARVLGLKLFYTTDAANDA